MAGMSLHTEMFNKDVSDNTKAWGRIQTQNNTVIDKLWL